MTATYWEVGRRIVEFEQQGDSRAEYGKRILERLSSDLTKRFGRGLSRANLEYMRRFYTLYSIPQTAFGELDSPRIPQTASGESLTLAQTRLNQHAGLRRFPLAWSHYIQLLAVEDASARQFYEAEALRGGWTVKQLKRQIGSLFYERTLLSKNKAAMLRKGAEPKPEDAVTPDEQIKDPLVLEFLDLKDEYSESELEDAPQLRGRTLDARGRESASGFDPMCSSRRSGREVCARRFAKQGHGRPIQVGVT